MANATALHGNLDLLVTERTRIIFKGLQRLFGTERGEGFDGGGHGDWSCLV
jgi:hypothetical protein